MDIANIAEDYKTELLAIGESTKNLLGNDFVQIGLTEHYQLKDTPLHLVLEFFVKGRSSEDDYGPCLSITFQHYDPAKGVSSLSPNDLYLMSDLSRGNGEIISFFETRKIHLSDVDFSSRLHDGVDAILDYIKKLGPSIIALLRTY